MPELTPEEITDWLHQPGTMEFFNRLRQMAVDFDTKVHNCLAKQETQQAADYNAGFHVIKEVLAGPQQMIDDLKEAKNENPEDAI